MPRKAIKAASPSASRSSSKRPAEDTPNRQSKRARATTRKSYVEPDTDTDEVIDKDKNISPRTEDEDEAVVSDYEDHIDKGPSSESESEVSASEEETVSKTATSRGRPGKNSALPLHKKHTDEKDLWKPGAKLAPGTQLIIKKPKARDAGDTPYTDATIHPNTMLFLTDLTANNERQWLKCRCLSAFSSTLHWLRRQGRACVTMDAEYGLTGYSA